MKQIVILRPKSWRSNSENLYGKLKLLDKAKDWQIVIQKYNPETIRTNKQNRYLHKIFALLDQYLIDSGLKPYGVEGWKTAFKKMFFGYEEIDTPTGITKSLPSTARLSTKVFTDFVEYIRRYAYDNLGEYYVMTPEEWSGGKKD
jgi:hypothetical protein